MLSMYLKYRTHTNSAPGYYFHARHLGGLVIKFSRHIEVYLYNAKLNQTSRKPQNSPLVTATSGFQVSSTGRKLFSASTTDVKTTFHSH